MPLQSELFRGDARLEAAATSNAAHIGPGSKGPSVAKIQGALNILDKAGLFEDGLYGSKTARAVLAYKSKRAIVNRSYQAQADDIVGIMTMAALDDELRLHDKGQLKMAHYRPSTLWRRTRPAARFG